MRTLSDAREPWQAVAEVLGLIVQRRRTEGAPAESKTALEALFRVLPVAVYVLDAQGHVTHLNPAAEQMFGWQFTELVDQPLPLLPTPPAVPREAHQAASLDEGHEVQCIRSDGAVIDVRLGSVALTDQGGASLGTLCVAVDVTEWKRSQLALRESEQRYRLLAEHATDLISTYSPDGTCVYVSPACRTMLGWEPEEFVGRSGYDFVHPDDAASVNHFHRQVIEQQQAFTVICRLRDRWGGYVWTESTCKPMLDPANGTPLELIVVSRDITARKQAEDMAHLHHAQLAHMSRLSSVGELATGLAHELNQPLTAIAHYADACEQLLAASTDARGQQLAVWIGKITAQADRAGDIVRRIKAVAGKSHPGNESVDIQVAVQSACELLATEARLAGIQLRLAIDPALPRLEVEKSQLEQVVVNLLQNAIDATRDGPAEGRSVVVNIGATLAGEIEVAVEDTGHGICPEVVGRLFEPFFTTKANGLGLGLALSRSIVERQGGRLIFVSNADRGVTFRFTLPTRWPGAFR